MSFFNELLKFFNRTDQVSDSTFKEIKNALGRGERCRFCAQDLKFPIGVLPCGHLYDADCLEHRIMEKACPECGVGCDFYDRVSDDQSVFEIQINPSISGAHIQNDSISNLDSPNNATSPSKPSCPKATGRSHKATDRSPNPASSAINSSSPRSLREGDQALSPQKTVEAIENVIHSPKISPVVKVSDTTHLLPKPFEEVTRDRVGPPHYNSIANIEKLSTLDQQIWALLTNAQLIENSELLLTKGQFFDATFEILKHYIPADLYSSANTIRAHHLGDLIKKNHNVGTVITYGMLLFLSLEYLSRTRKFSTSSKFRDFFKTEKFQDWMKTGYLKSTGYKQENLEQLFKGYPSDI